MTGLIPERRRLIEEAGDRPVRIEDPILHKACFLVREDVYAKVRGVHEAKPASSIDIPEGIRRSQDAFFHDLPELLKNRRLRAMWVAHHGDERVKVGRTQPAVIEECTNRGLKREEYDVSVIEPHSPEPEEIDYPSAWYEL